MSLFLAFAILNALCVPLDLAGGHYFLLILNLFAFAVNLEAYLETK